MCFNFYKHHTRNYMKCVFLNSKIVPWEDANIHVSSLAFTLGASVFEACRVNWNSQQNIYCIFRLHDHIDRLFDSMKILRMKLQYSKAEIVEIIRYMVTNWNEKKNGYLRITVYIDSPSIGSSIFNPYDVHSDLCITLSDSAYPKEMNDGIQCCISSWTRIQDNSMPPRVKSACNYQNTRLAGYEAVLNGYQNAILLNNRGKISEAGESTVFLLSKNGTLITPGINSDILMSITRDTVIKLWKRKLGEVVEERDVDRSELYIAEEVFITNTAKLIRPVLEIDRIKIHNGEVGEKTKLLQEMYINSITGIDPYFINRCETI